MGGTGWGIIFRLGLSCFSLNMLKALNSNEGFYHSEGHLIRVSIRQIEYTNKYS